MKSPQPVSRITTRMKETAAEVACRLAQIFPGEPVPALHFENPYQCVVSISLSAQTTDASVNKVTPHLFAAYPTPQKLASAQIEDIEELVHSLGFYHNKSKNLLAMARKVCSEYGGEIPATMEELTSLPGVARKTANLVLSESFGVTEGIAVDTHVFRIAHRLNLSRAKTPAQTEGDLLAVFPREQWRMVNYWLINFGRTICDAKKPQCATCPLADICPRKGVK